MELFTKKPVMHPFAIGLIWGIYKEETITGSFRYMEDGSFNTVDEEELELPEDAVIGLIHPIEFSKEERDAWKEQLEDYEIIQPVEQLDRTVYLISEEEVGQKAVERFEGVILNDLSLIGKCSLLAGIRVLFRMRAVFIPFTGKTGSWERSFIFQEPISEDRTRR